VTLRDAQTHFWAFPVESGHLVIGGIPLPRLAERVGRTPFFAYDRGRLTARVAQVRAHLPTSIRLSYAIKANPMPAVVQHMAGLVDGFDVASATEMLTALDTSMPPSRVSFAGPGKTAVEIRQAVAAGVALHVESVREIEEASRAAEAVGVKARVAIRVNPDFELKGSGMRMGGGAQQFGIDAEAVPHLLETLADRDVDFVGFHIFAGSQCLSSEALCTMHERTVDLAVRLARHAPGPVRHLNIGGGYGIPYMAGHEPLNLEPIGETLQRLMDTVVRTELPEAEVILELGRFLVGEAGVYVTRIIDRKVSRDRVFLITDGGLHHHLAASGNFGQVIRRNYPVAIGNRMTSSEQEEATVVGCLCTPLDLLGDKVRLPVAQPGDLFVVFQSGAYAKTASPGDFLSHPSAVEVLL
jgi:diaminopimelate decarboxylase